MCRSTVQMTYPARFLDLDASDAPSSSIKLVRSDQIGEPPSPIRYVALSHCWGSPTKPPLKTTRDNHSDHMRDIPLAALSRTYQDAIRVTRTLGVRYLWIDSLCIVQDDAADWMAEAVKMAHVYQGSHVTLAATASSDGDGGLSLDPPASATRVHVTFNNNNNNNNNNTEDGPRSGRHGGEYPTACFVRHPVGSAKEIWDAPLSKRAWVLQEQILSPRLIHFTTHQMYYQCHSGLESEDGTLQDDHLSSLQSHPYRGHGLRAMDTPARAVRTWWSWVAEYSSRSLTFAADRTAAIAGIVSYYQGTVGDAPILGLWEGTLWYDLSWQVEYDSSNQPQDKNFGDCRIPGAKYVIFAVVLPMLLPSYLLI